jgi:hypothetical protein
MPACVLSHVRDETELTNFFFFLLSGSVISCHTLRLSLFFITILDVIYIPQKQTTFYFFLGRDDAYTLIHTYVETLISSSLLSLQCTAFLFVLFWFSSLVLGLVEGFEWNGMEDGFKLSHFRYPLILSRGIWPRLATKPEVVTGIRKRLLASDGPDASDNAEVAIHILT